MASIFDLRQLDERPVDTGRFRLSVELVDALAALPHKGQLASQPEQQCISTVGSLTTTTTRELQTAAAPAGNQRTLEAGRV